MTEIVLEIEISQVDKDSKSMPNGLHIEYPLSGIVLKNLQKIMNVEIPITCIRMSQIMPYNIGELYIVSRLVQIRTIQDQIRRYLRAVLQFL